MISNNVTCHLSKPVARPNNQSRKDYLEYRKIYFNTHLKHKTVIFENKPTILLFSNLSGDECFNKFAAGDENNHTDKNGNLGYDRNRLERLDWIFEIIEKKSKCDSCTQFIILPDKKYPDRIVLNCFYNNYRIVIKIKKKSNYNIIMSAFYIETDEEKKERLKYKRRKKRGN